jgi:hypothetical protein
MVKIYTCPVPSSYKKYHFVHINFCLMIWAVKNDLLMKPIFTELYQLKKLYQLFYIELKYLNRLTYIWIRNNQKIGLFEILWPLYLFDCFMFALAHQYRINLNINVWSAKVYTTYSCFNTMDCYTASLGNENVLFPHSLIGTHYVSSFVMQHKYKL